MGEIRVFRADGEADDLRSIEIYNAVHPREPVGPMESREWKRQSRDSAVFLAELDGVLAGSAHVAVPSYSDIPIGQAYVLAQHRGRGVGKALYAAASDWAAARDTTALRTWVEEDDPDSLAWASRRGFAEQSRDALVELDLAGHEPRPSEPPPGVEIVTWAERPELAHGLYAVAVEASPDIPGNEDDRVEPFDEWLSVHMRGEGDRPEGTFVAVSDGEPVGYAKFSFWEAKPDTLFHDFTGVKRAWRGRGVARALKQAQLNWAKEQGYRFLRTSNEERNEPIRRLNADLGFQPIPGRIVLDGPLSSG
jgi:GNAT superfamily N-acetyltransferase